MRKKDSEKSGEEMTMADWKRLDPTGKKLTEALDRAVEREYAMPVCPHWQCRRRGIRVIRDNLVVGRPYLCMACRNRYTEEEVNQ